MADTVATAYVTLVPRLERGWRNRLEDETAKGSTAPGKKTGKGFGTAFVASAGKVIAGLGLGKMAVDFMGDALNSYGQFEQLAGGAEKIFSGIDMSSIVEDSKSAWADMNMSMNEYLTSINQVGASFKATMGDSAAYETARTGMQAIADYSSGTGRNLQELNEKYSLITRSTASYQSIADQFSGMLPATSAAFLEQAQAAGDLDSSYRKLTEVPIDQYQQAVTAAMARGVEALNLTGNTAHETEETLSGSIAGMRAAWSNFVTVLGDEDGDIDAAADALVSQTGTAFIQVVNVAGRVLGGLGSAILGKLREAWSSATGFLAARFSESGIGRFFMGIPRAASNAFDSLKKEVKRKLRQAQRFVSDGLDAIKGVFSGLNIKLPHIKLPHFNISGGKPPYGLGGAGSAPKFSIDWYANGGIFDGASLIGVGERGREAVLPIETPRYMRPLARAIANEMPHGGGVVINLTYNAGEEATQMVRDMARAIRAQRMMEA